MNRFILTPTLATLLATTACNFITNAPFPTKPSDIGPREAVLYGRFDLTDGSKFMALSFREVNTKKSVHIHLTSKQPIRMLRVPAGTYQLVGGLLKANAKPSRGLVTGSVKGIFEEQGKIFEAKPGRAYYVGEYRGWTKITDIRFHGNSTTTTYGGNIDQLEPAFAATTNAILAHAPWLADMQPSPAWDMEISPEEIAGVSPSSQAPDAEDLRSEVSLFGRSPAKNRFFVTSGMTGGGDDLLRPLGQPQIGSNVLRAGTQFTAGIGYERMVYWSHGYKHGVGVGLELGPAIWIKDLGGDDQVTFSSAPVHVYPHYLFRLGQRWFLRAGAGLRVHYLPNFDRSARDESLFFDTAYGLNADVGIYMEISPFALDLSARAERVSFTTGTTSVDGSNAGVLLRLHLVSWWW